jgi:hypothetical protein
MTILIANIGTSDLAVKIDEYEDYYIPVAFAKNQPNLDESNLNETEKFIWENRDQLICEYVCQPLGVNYNRQERGESVIYTYQFREVTKQLFNNYEQWKDKIIPCRILGVITQAVQKFNVKEAYIFVTDQTPEQHQDSIYLFGILQKWLTDNNIDLILHNRTIPKDIPAIALDSLLNYYYDIFHNLSLSYGIEEELLISIKGGTGQMQTALQHQAIASSMQRQIFIDPQLSVKNILSGNPSECILTSYWQYMRSQKYNLVKQLLERWDFDGSIKIIKDWNTTLSFLIDKDVLTKDKIKQNRRILQNVQDVLSSGLSMFNLDLKNAQNIIDNSNLTAEQKANFDSFINQDKYDILLNLYAQCFIYLKKGEIANFLARMGSFYEGVSHRIHKNIGGGGYKYFEKNKIYQRERKRDSVNQLIEYRASNNFQLIKEKEEWKVNKIQLQDNRKPQGILGLLKSLDYWCIRRNDLIHGGEGISQQRITEFNQKRDKKACAFEEILFVMKTILNSSLTGLRKEYKQNFVDNDSYYIYSDIRKWVIDSLMNDGLS